MTPLRRGELAAVSVVLAVLSWLLVRHFYGDLPPLHWWLPLPVGVLAVAEALGSRTLSARLSAERAARNRARGGAAAAGELATRPGPADPTSPLVRPVEPLLVARLAVLAQASAYVAAVAAGVWAGLVVHTVSELERLDAAAGDTVTGGLGVVLAVGLALAALRLEHVCRVP